MNVAVFIGPPIPPPITRVTLEMTADEAQDLHRLLYSYAAACPVSETFIGALRAQSIPMSEKHRGYPECEWRNGR
jgi:hypothetical protein